MIDLPRWFEAHGEWVALSAGLSVAMLVASALALPWIVARIPEDYFLHTARERRLESPHPGRRMAITVARNALGAAMVLAGAAMLVLPGQGLLTILAGLLVAEFPGKQRLELWVLRRPGVHRAANWLRARAGQPPLRLPHPDSAGSGHPGSG